MTEGVRVRVAVCGGTGLVGRLLVEALRQQGHEPVVLARSTGVDVVRGTGLEAALAGCDAVVDVSNREVLRAAAATAFFETATRHVGAAAARAGVRHHVVLSIVGVDSPALGYYVGKQRQEQALAGGPVPWSVLRSTQFHEYAAQVLALSKGPVAFVPRMRVQPVAAREVAAALARLAVGPAVGRAADLAGPEVHELPDLARRLLRARGRHRAVVPLRLPGAGGRALADGVLLPGPGAVRGTEPFEAWLARTGA